MADLRIVDAPVLLQESITDDVKMPTGGLGNYAIRLGDLVWYVVAKEQLASKSYVDNSSKGVQDKLDIHVSAKDNPHQVTKTQVGLGNVDNTADIDKPVSNAVESALLAKADKTDTYTKSETDSKISTLSSTTYAGHKGYATLAEAQAAQSTLAANTVVEVTNDTNTTKNGVYLWNGTTLTKSTNDVLGQAKSYVDSNPNFKFKELATENLNTILTTGTYLQRNAGYALKVEYNYPVKAQGVLEVVSIPDYYSQTTTYVMQIYTPVLHNVGLGFYIRRRNYQNNTWDAWKYIEYSDTLRSLIETSKNQAVAARTLPKAYEVIYPKNTKNLIDLGKIQVNKFISHENGALLSTPDNWGTTDFIPVTAGQQYTISGTFGYCAIAVYTDKTNTSTSLYNAVITALPFTFTVPTGGAYAVVNLYQKDKEYFYDVQMELGSSATAYVSGTNYAKIKKEFIEGINTPKDYEVVVKGSTKNLFKAKDIIVDRYVSTDGLLRTASGWGTTGAIPVTAGQQYTISGSFGYAAYGFYSSANDALTGSIPAIDFKSPIPSLPYTVTAPTGANVLIVSLYQASNQSYSNVQIELGATATTYESGDDTTLIKAEKLTSYTDSLNKNTVKFTSTNLMTVSATSDGTNYEHAFQIVGADSVDRSKVGNFISDKIDNTTVSSMNDDVAPSRLNGSTVGANHGYTKHILNAVAHGKTVADIGSLWLSSDGSYEMVLIDVPNANALYLARRASDISISTSTLVFNHKSGATNTAQINATANTVSQWYQSVKALKQRVYVDGDKVITGSDLTLSFEKEVIVSETYEIPSRASMIDLHINNVGTRFTSYENAQSVLSVTNNYRFDAQGGITIEAEYLVLASLTLDDLMMIQSIKRSFSGAVSYYIPKTKPVLLSGTLYNFGNPVDISGGLPASVYITPTEVKDGENAPDRAIQLSNSYGFALGYLPVLDADYSNKKLNATVWHMYIPSSSLKVYPYLISKGSQAVDVGTSYACVAYRQYFKRKAGETAVYPVYSRFGDYLYMHWHSAGLKRVELPEKLMGRAFEVSEKSANVTLISKVAGSVITANTTDSNSAYLVLKFN